MMTETLFACDGCGNACDETFTREVMFMGDEPSVEVAVCRDCYGADAR